jgi:hypothetical protein|nr:MAG TPA: hypothetical protein [Caudoviricetes sp.]
MPRLRQVTRTIVTTKVNVMCLDTQKCEPLNEVITVSGTFSDEDALLLAVKRAVDTDTLKAVQVVDKEELTNLYAMPEEEFIKLAKIVEKTKKVEE